MRRGGARPLPSPTSVAVSPAPAAVPPATGYTLVELLAVLAIVATLLAVAVPSFQAMLRSQRLNAGTDELFAAINFTRTQAIARNTRVAIVPSDLEQGDFAGGWIVFVDHGGSLVPNAPADILARHGPLAPGIRIGAKLSSQHEPGYLAYNGAGRSCTIDNSMAAHWGTLSVFDGEQVRRIKVNMLGRARVCNPATAKSGCEG
jgi:type IV fimbrial biogenesis protein FimT